MLSTSSHWSDAYIGRPYMAGSADCAHLAAEVRREVFHDASVATIERIERAASALGRVHQVEELAARHGRRTAAPADGDAVLMLCRGRPSHVGIYCLIGTDAYVLHAMANAGEAVRHRLRDLPRVGLAVEGFYQWKP